MYDVSLQRVDIAHNFDRLASSTISCCVTATPGGTQDILTLGNQNQM